MRLRLYQQERKKVHININGTPKNLKFLELDYVSVDTLKKLNHLTTLQLGQNAVLT